MRMKMICANCGGENVMRDAWAVWDIDAQDWTLGNVFDQGYCDDCEGEASIEEVDADAVTEDQE